MDPSPRPRRSWAVMPCSRPSRETRRWPPPGPLCACTSSTGRGGKGSARFVSCASWPLTGRRRVLKGARHERRTSIGRHAKGSLHPDGGRQARAGNVSGPHFAGWEIYHMKGSPADPNRLYASQTSGWFGQVIQRSCDGGKTWETPGGGMTNTSDGMPAGESNKFVCDSSPDTGKLLTTRQVYDRTQQPWEFKR